jgi:hypothetical protein
MLAIADGQAVQRLTEPRRTDTPPASDRRLILSEAGEGVDQLVDSREPVERSHLIDESEDAVFRKTLDAANLPCPSRRRPVISRERGVRCAPERQPRMPISGSMARLKWSPDRRRRGG